MAFDIFEFAAGATHPEDEVTIYFDVATAYQFRKLDEELNSSHRFNLSDTKVKQKERELKVLRKKLDESKVVVQMKGLTTKQRRDIQKEIDEKFGKDNDSDARSAMFDAKMFAEHYQSSTNAKGEKDETKWDADKASQFLQMIPEEAQQRIITKMIELSLRADNFERVETSASFS